jgi:hypothetical protein
MEPESTPATRRPALPPWILPVVVPVTLGLLALAGAFYNTRDSKISTRDSKISEQAGQIIQQAKEITRLESDRDSWKQLAQDRDEAKYKGSRYFEILGRFFEEIESEQGKLTVMQVVRVTQENVSETVRLSCGVTCIFDIRFDGLVNVPTRSERVIRLHRVERRAGRNEEAPFESTEHLLAKSGCAFRTPIDTLYAVAVVTMVSLDEVEIAVVAADLPAQPRGHFTALFGPEPSGCGVSAKPPAAAPPPG